MKTFLFLVMVLFAGGAFAQNVNPSETYCNSDRTIIRNGSVVTQDSTVECKERQRYTLHQCQKSSWDSPWGPQGSLSCNWSEQQTMQWVLTNTQNGVKVEWYSDENGRSGYLIVVYTYPPTNSGTCRDVMRVRKTGKVSEDKEYFIMCYNNDKGWVPFRGL